jgi:hypothetical protein
MRVIPGKPIDQMQEIISSSEAALLISSWGAQSVKKQKHSKAAVTMKSRPEKGNFPS